MIRMRVVQTIVVVSTVFVKLIIAPAASQEPKPGEVCRQVWDDTIVLTVSCTGFDVRRYSCPADAKEPCSELLVLDRANRNCGRATKMVCGQPEMFGAAVPAFEE